MEQFPVGRVVTLEPLVRRVLAPNPSAFTYSGTQTYIVGEGTVAVIDPGPDDPDHVAALLRAVEGETVSAILCTHTHRDHSPAAIAFKAATGAEIVGCAPLALDDSGPRADAAFDRDYAPDRVLGDGEAVSGPGWTLQAVATPGHTSNHLCFALPESGALFTGDHVMGWSTTVISPPDGNMGDYYRSLAKIRARGFSTLWPTHGPPVRDVTPFIDAYLAHRHAREEAIVARLKAGDTLIPEMVKVIYRDVDRRLHIPAAHSVLAHVIQLVEEGRVLADGPLTISTHYRLAR